MGNIKDQIKENLNPMNIFSSNSDINIKPILYEEMDNRLLSMENYKILVPLLNKNLDLFYLLLINEINNEKQIIKIINKYLSFQKKIDKNIIKNEIQYEEDNQKNFINLIKYIKNKVPELEINEEKINKIIEILSSVLNTKKLEIKNEFLFLCKLNLIRIDSTENRNKIKIIEDTINIKKTEEDEVKDYKEKESKIMEEEISDIDEYNQYNQYTIWNDSEEMLNLFNEKNIKDTDMEVEILKVIDDDKLCASYKNYLYIYQFKNNFNLITKRRFKKYIEYILILKNKNLLINFSYDEDYLYIFHKNKLSIIDKIFLFSKTINYTFRQSILYELSNNTIIFNCLDGLAIYNKIKGKYIFTKYIVTDYCKTRIIQMSNDYFLVSYNRWASYPGTLCKYSLKDFSMIKYLPSKYNYDSLLKINNNNILLYHTGYCNIIYLDINTFEIICENKFNGDIVEIIPVTNNIYIISSEDSTKYELNLCKIVQKNNEYHIIVKNKIKNEFYLPFKCINPSNKGFIFYISDHTLNILTTSHSRIKYKKDISNYFLRDSKVNPDHFIRIFICGNSSVGKKTFIEKTSNCNLVKLYGKVLSLVFEELIFDTLNITYMKMLANNSNSNVAIIIFYSINSKESFDDINKYLLELRQNLEKPVNIFLIGNKKDLEKDRKITKEEARKFAEKNRINYFDEISLKNDNPNEIKRIIIDTARVVYKSNIKGEKKKKEIVKTPCGGDSDSLPPKKKWFL